MLRTGFANRILPFDSGAARAYAEIAAARRRMGRPIPEADCQIAAIARSHGMAVATRNVGDFTTRHRSDRPMDWCLIASSSGMRPYARPRASRDDAGRVHLQAAGVRVEGEHDDATALQRRAADARGADSDGSQPYRHLILRPMRGLNPDEAAARVRKIFPMYGKPTDESVTTGDDRPLPPELRGRIDRWRKKHAARNSCSGARPSTRSMPLSGRIQSGEI